MQLENITTKEALISTIETDTQVYRWFTHLVTQPLVKETLLNEKNTEELYSQIDTISKQQTIIYILLAIFMSLIVFSRPFLYLWILIILGLLFPCIKINNKKKHYVAQLSIILISKDFDDSVLHKTTLYQIGEIYSRKYKTSSLSDSIYLLDHISRHTLIVSYVIFALIWPINSWFVYISIIGSYFIVNAIVKTKFLYKYLH